MLPVEGVGGGSLPRGFKRSLPNPPKVAGSPATSSLSPAPDPSPFIDSFNYFLPPEGRLSRPQLRLVGHTGGAGNHTKLALMKLATIARCALWQSWLGHSCMGQGRKHTAPIPHGLAEALGLGVGHPPIKSTNN